MQIAESLRCFTGRDRNATVVLTLWKYLRLLQGRSWRGGVPSLRDWCERRICFELMRSNAIT